jgi:signal transduction histidine kinase
MQPDASARTTLTDLLDDTGQTEWVTRTIAAVDAFRGAEEARRRAECTARIQSDATQLALDLLVREPDITGFFRGFSKSLVEECESQVCGIWLLNDDATSCDLWLAYVVDRFHTPESPDWETTALRREAIARHLMSYREGWTTSIEYCAADPRLPEDIRAFNCESGIDSMVIAPLLLPTHNLGWVALCSRKAEHCEMEWRRAVVDAMARQATMALHQSRLAERSRLEARRQAVLEERNRIARDIHDTLTQGFAAILMQLQAAQRSAPALPPAVATSIETAVDLARTHMVEARRSVGVLRPPAATPEDLSATLRRIVGLARRTTDVPIELALDNVPALDEAVEREIAGIAQEALTNAIRHARARHIRITASGVRSIGFRLSVGDDGRGIHGDLRDTGFGMTSMQERAERIGASLTIVTAPRSGTEVVLAWEPPAFSIPGSMSGEPHVGRG